MRLVLVGPPGSGKGTQAKLLAERLGLRYIGTGDILREAIRSGSEAGKRAESGIEAGNLVPDRVVNDLVADLFIDVQPPADLVLDGYPRTLAQAIAFDELMDRTGISLDAVLNFQIDDEEVVRRVTGRRICSNPQCGTPYHTTCRPPRAADVCDRCGSPLTIRADDTESTIRTRLGVFHSHTDGVLEHYARRHLVRNVSTAGEVEDIYAHILKQISPNT